MDAPQLVSDAAIEAAIAWWLAALQTPATPDTYNNGDRSGLHGVLMSMVARTADDPTRAQLDAFAEGLRVELRKAGEYGLSLRVDYGPEGLLGRVVRAAQIDASRLPWKTRMLVAPERVTVAKGYGADDVVLWGAPLPEPEPEVEPVCEEPAPDACEGWPETNPPVALRADAVAHAMGQGTLGDLVANWSTNLGNMRPPPCHQQPTRMMLGFPRVTATKHRPVDVQLVCSCPFRPEALIVAARSAPNYTIEDIRFGVRRMLVDDVPAVHFAADSFFADTNLATSQWVAPRESVTVRVRLNKVIVPPRLALCTKRQRIQRVRFRPATFAWGTGPFEATLFGWGMRDGHP